jgi:trimethylamine--corrinoid protein Co-methyltransferase
MASFTPNLVELTRRARCEPLLAEQLDALRDATLEVLADVGVVFPSAVALDLFAEAGATVDRESGLVRLSPDLVAQALAGAPRNFVLAGREERFDLHLDGRKVHICTEGVGTRVVDLDSGHVRSSRKDDVATFARVVDALPLVGFVWPPVSAQDHPASAPLHECHAALTNTLKHVRGGTTMQPVLARAVVRMAEVLAGSSRDLRQRPPICANICTIAPLSQDPVGIEAALIYAQAGLPVSFMAMPAAGSTAPASLLGALVQGEAEVVAGMVLLQLAQPGCPVMHSNYVALTDPRTGGYVGEVPLRLDPIVAQLSHEAWGVPDLGGVALSGDSRDVDWVAGMRTGMGAALLPSDASDISGYLGGLTAGAMVLHPELLILQHEALMNARAWSEGVRFERADLALDVIRDIGPGGHFMAHRHTREHLRDFHLTLWQKVAETAAAGRGGASPASASDRTEPSGAELSAVRAAARSEYARLAREHEPEPISDDVLAELDAIVAAAERQLQRCDEGPRRRRDRLPGATTKPFASSTTSAKAWRRRSPTEGGGSLSGQLQRERKRLT